MSRTREYQGAYLDLLLVRISLNSDSKLRFLSRLKTAFLCIDEGRTGGVSGTVHEPNLDGLKKICFPESRK